jgi:hypothetical protein
MNIFFLHRDPEICAQYHCDKHVVKMIVETAQILSTVARKNGVDNNDLYRPTHINHPSVKWAGQSRCHYNYLIELLYYLLQEYNNRYHKVHKTSRLLTPLTVSAYAVPDGVWIDPPLCMPDDCKQVEATTSYQLYYMKYKNHFATWRNGIPDWFKTVDK